MPPSDVSKNLGSNRKQFCHARPEILFRAFQNANLCRISICTPAVVCLLTALSNTRLYSGYSRCRCATQNSNENFCPRCVPEQKRDRQAARPQAHRGQNMSSAVRVRRWSFAADVGYSRCNISLSIITRSAAFHATLKSQNDDMDKPPNARLRLQRFSPRFSFHFHIVHMTRRFLPDRQSFATDIALL